MIYNQDKNQAKDFAAQALERIENESLAPTPDAFAVLYAYYAGINPDITRAIDILMAKENKLTADRCAEIYSRFMAENKNEDFMQKAGDLVSATLSDMSTMMASVQTATTHYSGSLEDVSNLSEGDVSPKELHDALYKMKAETQKILEENKVLEAKLEQSTENVHKLRNEMESVRKEAITDGLTSLPNRKYFDMEIERMMAEAKQNGEKMCLMMMDIDHFKSFNDTYGHQVGDQVLRLVGKTLQHGVKGKDFASRYGGEEFSVMLPDTPLHLAEKVANSLRIAVAGKEIINRSSGEKLGKITMSIGVAEYDFSEKSNALIERADAALYKAKSNGRNRVEIAENDPNDDPSDPA